MIGAILCAGCLWGCGDNTTPTTETTQEITTTEEVTTEATTTEATTESTTAEDTEAATQAASEAESSETLPISEAINMTFASGAGGWSTELTLNVNDYTYSMTLVDTNVQEKEEQITDGIRYIPSDIYGIDDGKTFYFYTKEAPVAELSEDFLSWRMGVTSEKQQNSDTLSGYGLYNKEAGCGFYTYE